MYLKRLEVQGFKSMADRVELQFNPGITAVVGPNGSGKSNISDAIRWVLGEQSAKSLRGAKMEDIIFSGSDKRKPVGMAEVILTLDNSTGIFPLEYSEVTVTRRVFRSGDSEFFINKSACRLKDIHELFMDTGIGREGYSIIGQGKIDEILSTRSEDRRQIIEEAAGIVKYKTRKLQAVRKLEDTEQNLVRINDIITELEMQVGPLEEQAMKARSYLEYKEELDKLEISLSVQQLGDQKTRLETMLREEEDLRQKLVGLETEVRKTDSTIEELKHNLNLTNELISEHQQKVYEKNSFVEKMEAEIRVNEERVNNLGELKSRLEQEIQALEDKVLLIKNQSKSEAESYEELQKTIISLELQVADLEKELESLESGSKDRIEEIERTKTEIFDTINAVANLNNRVHALEAEEKSLRRRKEQLQNSISEVALEQTQLTESLQDLAELEETHRQQLLEMENRTGELFTQINENIASIKEADKEGMALASERQNLASKQKVLQDMEQDYEGYFKGVKETLKAGKANRLAGVEGVIAELLTVPKKYETAIEVALGGALQHIVTRSEKDAKEAINFLKKSNFGRATFLPLDTIKSRDARLVPGLLNQKGCLGIAAELVSFEKKYAPAVSNLLGSILIAENIEVATQLAKTCGYSTKIVTLEGDVVNPGGSLTGGSYNKNRNSLLGRKREIDELNSKISLLDQKVAAALEKVKELKEVGQILAGELDAIKEKIHEGNLKIAGYSAEKEQIRIRLTKLNQAMQVHTFEADQLEERITEILNNTESTKNEIQKLKEYESKLSLRVAENQQAFTALEENKSARGANLTTKKIDLAKLRQEEIGLKQTMDRVNREVNEVNEQVVDKTREIGELNQQILELSLASQKLREEISSALEQKLSLEETLAAEKNKRDYLNSEINQKEDASKSSNKEFFNLQNQVHGIEVKKARLETEVENEQRKLLEEFALSYEEALLRRVEIGSKKEASIRIKELKGLIGGLGAVNVGAIEEHEKVSERYEFLKTQCCDLEEAKASLYQVIEEMDQIMTKRFRKTYEEINRNFQEVFKELFGGGNAELQMTDGEKLLETGVEIIAQPPGKKPQHLSLLSGGERALTAISLLFAVLKVKPSPFCVLDEIEASLDEANVDRFASFLQRFSRETQFIVVTHRKGTMEAANVLYGVTMDENGISKMVSMRLSEGIDKVS